MPPSDDVPAIWSLTPHTQAKHELLKHYLDAWYPILSRFQQRVIVLDGFAGPGVYAGGEPGSPRIVLSTLLDHHHLSRMRDCEFLLAFNEHDEQRFAELERQVGHLRHERDIWPANVKVRAYNQDFTELAEEILASLAGREMAPIFAFLDPFGYRDVPLDLIRRLMAFRRSELFIYFDFNSVNRFSTSGVVDETLLRLFGTDEFMQAPPAGDRSRETFLHDLYQRQLEDVVGFDYVRSFQMLNETGHGYYLFFCTRNVDGLDKMKQAMWKVAPAGDYRFDDRFAAQHGLFDEAVDTGPLRAALLREFDGQTVPIDALQTYTILHTSFASTHLKRLTLAHMQRAGLITSPNQRLRNTFPEGTLVTFPRR